ncbi:arsenate reductase [Pollutimonas subterranea]|uniref:Arsenate reductase n=1 Tax=Pollutimonas subterranea TaxID=2045210 RepID=A0A2N4U809_9BURK|nr:Spx/MgsR family RNA polymerase-binding regulatory protein [Pollutimonas subterranea]PLC51155.1 arsenate reductase [Pollutimonas subterranea]
MDVVQLYGLKNCSTCVKAMNWLTQRELPYSFTDYREQPISGAQLVAWAGVLGGWEKLVNRASMTWRNLPESRKAPGNEQQWLALIAEFPALVKRPVAVTGPNNVAVGFSEKKYSELFTPNA